jgi:hypothetical protein
MPRFPKVFLIGATSLSALIFMLAQLRPTRLSLRIVGIHLNFCGIFIDHPSSVLRIDKHISILQRLRAIFNHLHFFGNASNWTLVIPWWLILLIEGALIAGVWFLARRISNRRGFPVCQQSNARSPLQNEG